jgi:hypothetical protein
MLLSFVLFSAVFPQHSSLRRLTFYKISFLYTFSKRTFEATFQLTEHEVYITNSRTEMFLYSRTCNEMTRCHTRLACCMHLTSSVKIMNFNSELFMVINHQILVKFRQNLSNQGGTIFRSEIHKLIISIWNKKELLDQW